MAARPFSEGIAELKRIIGSGRLDATVVVDQPYASAQNAGGWISGPNAGKKIRNHPRGGDKGFLTDQITERAPHELQGWMSRAIGESVPLVDSARQFATEVAKGVDSNRTPIRDDVLRKSASVEVTDNGATVYRKPAAAGRIARKARSAARRRKRAF